MGLLSYLLGNRPHKPVEPSPKEIEAQYQEWVRNVTADDIRHLFLASLREGNPWLSVDVKPTELEYFDRLVAGFDVTSDGQLRMTSIINHLTRAHNTPARAEAIQTATSILGTLIISHACFPFSSPVLLTKDAFCRAILLLSDKVCYPGCRSSFGQAIRLGDDYVVSQRTHQARLLFIYSALAHPPGVPTCDDILDTVCRVRYPWGYFAKPDDTPHRRPVTDFQPLAERLEPLQDVKLPAPFEALQPLQDLVTAFPPRWGEPPAETTFGERDKLNAKRFVRWAMKVQLLQALGQIFSAFLRET